MYGFDTLQFRSRLLGRPGGSDPDLDRVVPETTGSGHLSGLYNGQVSRVHALSMWQAGSSALLRVRSCHMDWTAVVVWTHCPTPRPPVSRALWVAKSLVDAACDVPGKILTLSQELDALLAIMVFGFEKDGGALGNVELYVRGIGCRLATLQPPPGDSFLIRLCMTRATFRARRFPFLKYVCVPPGGPEQRRLYLPLECSETYRVDFQRFDRRGALRRPAGPCSRAPSASTPLCSSRWRASCRLCACSCLRCTSCIRIWHRRCAWRAVCRSSSRSVAHSADDRSCPYRLPSRQLRPPR